MRGIMVRLLRQYSKGAPQFQEQKHLSPGRKAGVCPLGENRPMRSWQLLLAAVVFAQRFQPTEEEPRPIFPKNAEYHFVRLEYTDLPQYHRRFGFASRDGRGEGWWLVDWPDADDHFSTGVQRLTRIDTGEPVHFRLTDDRLFDYPWIYATQTGWWGLSDKEIERLREYLLRGGFLVVDDFWGPEQWEIFAGTMARVLPGHEIV